MAENYLDCLPLLCCCCAMRSVLMGFPPTRTTLRSAENSHAKKEKREDDEFLCAEKALLFSFARKKLKACLGGVFPLPFMRFKYSTLALLCVCVYTLWYIWVSSFPSPPPPLGIASHAQSSTTYIYHLSLFARTKSFTSFFFFFCCGSDNDDMKTRANIHPKSLILFYLFIYFRWREPSLAFREQRRHCCCVEREDVKRERKIDFHSEVPQEEQKKPWMASELARSCFWSEVNKKEIHTATTKDDDDDDDEWHCWELRKLWKFFVLRSSDERRSDKRRCVWVRGWKNQLHFSSLSSPPSQPFHFFAPISQAVWLVHWVSFERGKLAFLPHLSCCCYSQRRIFFTILRFLGSSSSPTDTTSHRYIVCRVRKQNHNFSIM